MNLRKKINFFYFALTFFFSVNVCLLAVANPHYYVDNKKLEEASSQVKRNDDEDSHNPVRKKQLFEAYLGGQYNMSVFKFDTPGAHSILQWGPNHALGGEAEITFNPTSRFWIRASFNYNDVVSGKGYDDDIKNGVAVYSKHTKMDGFNTEQRLVIGFDVLRFDSFDFAIYGGFFNKNIGYRMGDGKFWNGRSGTERDLGGLGWTQKTETNFIGAVLGAIGTNYTYRNITSVFAELYITRYVSTQYWPLRNMRWSMFSNSPAFGFGLGVQNDIRIADLPIWVRLKAKGEFIRAIDLEEKVSGYSGVLPTYNSDNYAEYGALTLGVGLIWR